MNRRSLIAAGAAAAALAAGGRTAAQFAAPHPLHPAWTAWKAAYLLPEGRVVDAFQRGASHSESQGYGMALACGFADAEAFAAMLRWTERNLALRQDALFSWRWLPDSDDPVPDRNNASDGDLFVAWALVRAAALFGEPAYARRAAAIAADLATRCIVPDPGAAGRVVMLPAADGFVREGGVIVNPSYYFSRAMREVAAATGTAALAQAAADGESLMADLARGGTTPDWVQLTAAGPAVAAGLSADTGYEALRVPLFLLWSGAAAHPAVAAHATALLAGGAGAGLPTPTVIDRATGAVRETSVHPGYAAIAALAACAITGGIGAAIPPFTTDQPYYPATLHLMTLAAQAEGYPRCLPV